jgi:type III secretion protein U
LKLLLKVVLLLGTFFLVITAAIDPLAKLVYAPAADLLRISGTLVWRLMGYAAIVYAVGAALDYAHQSYEFLKQHRMSIEEVRQDYHETEGNPLFKRRRRSIAREALSSAHLSQANVVVADATRVAVALFYVADDTPLPLVIAKGQDESALRIRHQAEREGVPVYEDAALARQLFRDVPLNDYINEAAIEPVGAAFNWAQENDRRGR